MWKLAWICCSPMVWAMSWKNVSLGICDQVKLKPACSATEASYSLETLDIASIGIILSKQRTTMVLTSLHECAGWSAPLLFAYGIRHIFSWSGSYKAPFNMGQLKYLQISQIKKRIFWNVAQALNCVNEMLIEFKFICIWVSCINFFMYFYCLISWNHACCLTCCDHTPILRLPMSCIACFTWVCL